MGWVGRWGEWEGERRRLDQSTEATRHLPLQASPVSTFYLPTYHLLTYLLTGDPDWARCGGCRGALPDGPRHLHGSPRTDPRRARRHAPAARCAQGCGSRHQRHRRRRHVHHCHDVTYKTVPISDDQTAVGTRSAVSSTSTCVRGYISPGCARCKRVALVKYFYKHSPAFTKI